MKQIGLRGNQPLRKTTRKHLQKPSVLKKIRKRWLAVGKNRQTNDDIRSLRQKRRTNGKGKGNDKIGTRKIK